MITIEQYVGPWADSPDWTVQRQANARRLLAACINLESLLSANGVSFPDHPHGGTGLHNARYDARDGVSGQTYGGFRPQDCTQGAPHSSHKEGLAVDRYDPGNLIDDWLMNDYQENVDAGTPEQSALVQCGIYIEHPDSTDGWSHWTIRAPGSGRRIFYP